MRIAYLDCFAGISGDMLLGALVDAGVPRSVLEDATNALGLNASLQFETVDRSGISATKVHVMEEDHLADDPSSPQPAMNQSEPEPLTVKPKLEHQHVLGHARTHNEAKEDDEAVSDAAEHAHLHGRSLTTIRQLIEDSTLAADVRALAIHTFELLGRSEAKIHNVPVDEVHFHEVGGVDAMVDIVASAAGILHLNVSAWHSSPINVGGGTVRCAHGVFPVPAPAAADLLRGFPTYSAQVQKELVTPTGAALLRALSPSFGPQPAMVIEHIGYGAGTRNPAGFPNVLRLSIGEPGEPSAEQQSMPAPASISNPQASVARSAASGQTVTVLETALDDATPQLLAYVTEKALKLGALDVMLTPVIMKKGRPGTMLTLLANPEDAATFEQLLLRETTTLGVRIRQDRRVCLDRSHVMVDTEYGSIRVKTGSADGETLNANPEFEDCKHAAEQSGIPLKQIHAAAIAAYMSRIVRETD